MNKERRKRIAEAAALIERGRDILDEVLSDEQEAYGNLPEGLRDGKRGQAMQEAVDGLETAISELEGMADQIAGIGEV